VTAYLELADYLLIAERVLSLPAEAIANFDRIGLAESALAAPRAGFGGVEAYPDSETKVAVLCWHLVKNHPLPDGNKRCAFLATVEFVERNGRRWLAAPDDPDETDCVIRAVASRELSETDFRDWIGARSG
jgi:death on curing protein